MGAPLDRKIKLALDENRTLMLGAQVLVGFDFQSVLMPGFGALPRTTQLLHIGALAVMLVAIGLLIAPSAYHRLHEHGADSPRVHRLVMRLVELALLPFAIGFGIDLFLAGEKVMGRRAGFIMGLAAFATAIVCWYGLELAQRKKVMKPLAAPDPRPTPLGDRITQVLAETRLILPGAQALLGFQLAAMLSAGFDKLPGSSKIIHLGCLGLIGLATVLLIMPSAYHRIVERGEDSERFHRFAGHAVTAALVPLGLGICGDFYVVAAKVAGAQVAAWVAGATVILYFVLWFGAPLARSATAAPTTPR